MQPKTFKPRYSLLTWSLLLFYCAPWLLGVANALAGWTGGDLRLFTLLAGAAWFVAGLLHLKGALLRRILFSKTIIVEMYLQRPAAQAASLGVHVFGNLVRFECRDVHLQYLANAGELMHLFVFYAGRNEMNLVYDSVEEKAPGWTVGKSLLCLAAFAVYMAACLLLGFRPVALVGPATDALLPALLVGAAAGLIIRVAYTLKARVKKREAAETRRM
jgi:hypothetical protein